MVYKKKILHLTLKEEWFDLIAVEQKKIEYREFKEYWISRLMNKHDDSLKEFDEIHFKNGYSKDCPFMRVECIEVELGYSRTYDADCFKIHLGKILEIKNWLKDK